MPHDDDRRSGLRTFYLCCWDSDRSNKKSSILIIPPTKELKEVCIFLGKTGYYHRFIEIYSRIASPMFALVMKDA